MNIFSELEGLKGELLATAGLRVLLIRSQACRNAFLKLLNEKSPVGLVASRSHFSCYTEYATTHESQGAGRLDLIIELDSVVVGFEVKLAAEFQPEQPIKYEEELNRMANALGTIRRRVIRSFMTILAPKSRCSEVLSQISYNHTYISWEETLEVLKKAEEPDQYVNTLIAEFSDFLADHLHFLPRFETWAPHLESHWQPNGTDEQWEFLRKIVPLLPGAGVRAGSGETWVGYYFQPKGHAERIWIGFIPAERVKSACTQGAWLVVSRKAPVADPGVCSLIDLEEPVSVDGQNVSTWRLPINPAWSQPEDWKEALAPFIKEADIV